MKPLWCKIHNKLALQGVLFNHAIHDSNTIDQTFTADTNTVTDSLSFATAMAKVADDTKAKDLMLLHVEPLSSWTSYMLLVTVSSRPQLTAVLAKIEREAVDGWGRPRKHQKPGRYGLSKVLLEVFTFHHCFDFAHSH